MAYTIITHDRKAHLDEVLAAALLGIHLQEDPAEILRIPSREAAQRVAAGEIGPEEWFLDCGMAFDKEARLFDHHQEGSLGCAALLVFQSFFPHLEESELGDYIRLASRVDTEGLRSLDDYETVGESQFYWSFSQKLLLKQFEADPKPIVQLVRKGLEDKIRFEEAKREAARWAEEDGHCEILRVDDIKVLVYRACPPVELAPAVRAVDGSLIDRDEIHAVYSFDERAPENRVLFRTNWGHERLDFTQARPAKSLFCHQGGFLLKFRPAGEEEWIKLVRDSRTEPIIQAN